MRYFMNIHIMQLMQMYTFMQMTLLFECTDLLMSHIQQLE